MKSTESVKLDSFLPARAGTAILRRHDSGKNDQIEQLETETGGIAQTRHRAVRRTVRSERIGAAAKANFCGGRAVTLAGRIMSRRYGQFAVRPNHLKDGSGRIQLFVAETDAGR